MRRLTADFILHPNGTLVPGHTLYVESDGSIAGLEQQADEDHEYFDGILCPGFINAHGHLELSHLQGKIERGIKLTGFISQFVSARLANSVGIDEAAQAGCKSMWEKGIQGAGDICNTTDSFQAKKNSPVRFYNFVEVFSPVAGNSVKALDEAISIVEEIRSSGYQGSLVPHAPYTVNPALFRSIRKYAENNVCLWSMHNQETAGENEMFMSGKGTLIEMFRSMGIGMEWLVPTGKSSLVSVSEYFPSTGKLMLVHNTYTGIDDVRYLENAGLLDRCWFCLCPSANMYIEERLPNIPMLMHEGCRIAIGTDSLASNDALSVLDELKLIHSRFPRIPVSSLLNWATSGGADFFGWNDLGRFSNKCRPGILNLPRANPGSLPDSISVKRII